MTFLNVLYRHTLLKLIHHSQGAKESFVRSAAELQLQFNGWGWVVVSILKEL